MTDILVFIPTFNEEEGIGHVIDSLPDTIDGVTPTVLVIDGGSSDSTREVAAEHGAEVVEQTKDGYKGSAVRQVVEERDADIYVMLDGDDTYAGGDAAAVARPVIDGRHDHVLGNRLDDLEDGAMPLLNRIGNYLFTGLATILYRQQVGDLLSGYRAFSADLVDSIELRSTGFDIETELTLLTLAGDHSLGTVPVSYRDRKGDSKLNPVRDGLHILYRMAEVRTRGLRRALLPAGS